MISDIARVYYKFCFRSNKYTINNNTKTPTKTKNVNLHSFLHTNCPNDRVKYVILITNKYKKIYRLFSNIVQKIKESTDSTRTW